MADSFNGLSISELKDLLDEKVKEYNTPDFLPDDPLGLVHEFSEPKNQEIIGLLVATIAWGNRKSIIKSGRNLIEIFDAQPYDFVMNHSEKDLKQLKFVHRTFQSDDLKIFIQQLKKVYAQNESLESAFSQHQHIEGVKGRIVSFRNKMTTNLPVNHRVNKHLSNPLKGSSAKRLNMFLRWMVRPSTTGVDLGIWNTIPLSELCIPLDVHTGNIARAFQMTHRKSNDWKTLEEIMQVLRRMNPNDPSVYDFALFGLGAIEPKK